MGKGQDCTLYSKKTGELVTFSSPGNLSNPGLLHCRRILNLLRHQGSPYDEKVELNIGSLHFLLSATVNLLVHGGGCFIPPVERLRAICHNSKAAPVPSLWHSKESVMILYIVQPSCQRGFPGVSEG